MKTVEEGGGGRGRRERKEKEEEREEKELLKEVPQCPFLKDQ